MRHFFWAMQKPRSFETTFPTVKSLLSRDCIHNVGCNETFKRHRPQLAYCKSFRPFNCSYSKIKTSESVDEKACFYNSFTLRPWFCAKF